MIARVASEMAVASRKAKFCVGGVCSSFCFILALVAALAFAGLTVFRQDYLNGMVQEQIDEVSSLTSSSVSLCLCPGILSSDQVKGTDHPYNTQPCASVVAPFPFNLSSAVFRLCAN